MNNVKAGAKAVTKKRSGGTQKLIVKSPVRVRVTFLTSLFADAAELLPNIRRIDALKVEYTSNNMVEAYKTFELLTIASRGLVSMLEDLR